MNGTDFSWLEAGRFDTVAENFAGGGGRWGEFRLDAGWQVEATQTLFDQLAGHEQARLLVESDDDEREPELGVREHADRIRHAGQRDFERYGDLLFDLFRGAAGKEGDDRDLGIGDIGKGFDRQGAEGGNADADEQHKTKQDEQRFMEREMDDALHHLAACFVWPGSVLKNLIRCRLPSMTTFSPSLTPLRISIRPPRSGPA